MLFRNTLANAVTLLTSYGYSLILAPLLLTRLGLEAFGVWAVTGAIAQYAALLDMGVRRALARFVALFDAESDRRGIQETLGLGLVVVTCIGLVIAPVAYALAPVLSAELGVLDTDEMRIVLLSSVAIFLCSSYGGVLDALPAGLRRMVPPNVAGTVAATVNFAASVTALMVDPRLTVYALANAGAGVVAIVLSLVSFLYVWRRPFFAVPSLQRARQIISYGLKSQLILAVELVNQQMDKVVIAVYIGPRAAGAYELAARVVNAVRQVGIISLSAMVPTATAAIVERGRSTIGWWYSRYTIRTLGIALPLFALVSVSSPYLLVAWLGQAPEDTTAMIALLSTAFSISMLSGVAVTLSLADGRPGAVSLTTAIAAATNIAVTFSLVPVIGIWGALLGTIVGELTGHAIFLTRFHRHYALPARAALSALGRPAALALAVAVPFAVWQIFFASDVEGRPGGLLGSALIGGGYAVIYWIAASRLGHLPDRLTLRRGALRVRQPLRMPR